MNAPRTTTSCARRSFVPIDERIRALRRSIWTLHRVELMIDCTRLGGYVLTHTDGNRACVKMNGAGLEKWLHGFLAALEWRAAHPIPPREA